MKRLLFLILNVPMLINAQDKVGVRFEQNKNWQEVLRKAKAESKYVFVDCYTTWCGPCKKMDNEVYTSKKVGDSFNNRFVCIKVQMDTSASDDPEIRNLYADAAFIKNKYDIEAFPTLLFFTPDGKLLNKSIGMVKPEELIALGDLALDPQQDYYQLLKKFDEGDRDMKSMNFLVQQALKLGDTVHANMITKVYFNLLKKKEWFKKENIELMRLFTKSSFDKGFYIFYHYADTINKIVDDNSYAQSVVHSVINREMAAPFIADANKRNASPSWTILRGKIKAKYNLYYADRVTLAAKSSWNRKMGNWEQYIHYFVLFNQRYSSFKAGFVDSTSFEPLIWNNRAWEVFKYSSKPSELKIALKWSEYAVMMEPESNWMDTYANILYKLGQKDLAMKWQTIVIKTANEHDPNYESYRNNLEKMKKGEMTWIN